MSRNLRCAVIGAGGIARSHIEGFRKHKQAEVVAVAEINSERRQEALDTFNIPKGVEDYHDLLADKEIDAVSIALPNFLHSKSPHWPGGPFLKARAAPMPASR